MKQMRKKMKNKEEVGDKEMTKLQLSRLRNKRGGNSESKEERKK